MAAEDMFELRVEFQDLIVDVALSIPCGCAEAVRAGLETGNPNPRACLGCRARYVIALGRRLRGWSPYPTIGLVHIAGRGYRSVEYAARRRPNLQAVDGRQACVWCGAVLRRGPAAGGFYDEGEAVVAYVARHTSLGRLVGAGLTGRDPRQGAPGEVPCTALGALGSLHLVQRSEDAAGVPSASLGADPSARRRGHRGPGSPDPGLGQA